MRGHRLWGVALAALVLAGACSGDDGDAASDDTATDDTTAPTTPTTTTAPGAEPERYRSLVEELSADELEGRDNQTPGSTAAQELLTEHLAEFTEPLPGAADGGYAWEFAVGTNLLGLIPGGEKADEYLVLGAHYDGLGSDCRQIEPDDEICNGAADNAAGVAAVLEVGRVLAEAGPERSVVVALWDAEEDGLLGAHAYVDDPPLPLDQTVAYLNWDIQGTNLTPSLSDTTVMVGAETGGPSLVDAANAAAEASSLETLALSLLFGQGRSDHAVFAEAGVPTVFFTDANNSCYHTTSDDLEALDFDKLGEQILTGTALAEDLSATEAVPAFAADAPAATFTDAQSMYEVVSGSQEDFDLLGGGGTAVAEAYLADLEAMVEAGETAFDDEAVSTLLGGAVDLVEALTTGECTGFVDQ
jgi:Peptidase family M28